MVRPFDRRLSEEQPSSLTWLLRFEVCLTAICDELLGTEWVVQVDPEKRLACIRKLEERVCVPIHPGLHVVTPMWAAQRIGDQLHLEAVARGFIEPATGTASADEQ